MGLGKAQKQRRNIDAKIAKKEAAEKARAEWIKGLDNDRIYLVDLGCGQNRMLGREIKAINKIAIDDPEPIKINKLSRKQKIKLKLQTISLAIVYACDQIKELYKIKRDEKNISS